MTIQRKPVRPIHNNLGNYLISLVCRHFNTNSGEIKSRLRTLQVATARQVIMYILYRNTQMTLSEIGTLLGGRHYSTVIYGTNQIRDRMIYEDSLRALVNVLEGKFQKKKNDSKKSNRLQEA